MSVQTGFASNTDSNQDQQINRNNDNINNTVNEKD